MHTHRQTLQQVFYSKIVVLEALPPPPIPSFPTEQISRTLAAKAALAIRYDALGEDESTEVGEQCRAKVESRVMEIEQGQVRVQFTAVKGQSLNGRGQGLVGLCAPGDNITPPTQSRPCGRLG